MPVLIRFQFPLPDPLLDYSVDSSQKLPLIVRVLPTHLPFRGGIC